MRSLATHQHRAGADVGILSLYDTYVSTDLQHANLTALDLRFFRAYGLGNVFYAPGIVQTLLSLPPSRTVVHLHHLWLYLSRATVLWAQRRQGRYILSPHGMLDPWAIQKSRLKKRVASWLWETANLHGATCLHALTPYEYMCIRTYGLQNPVCIIPNGVDVDRYTPLREQSGFTRRFPQTQNKKILLFLARLHPKKGIDTLFHAWSRVAPRHPDWVLVMAGADADWQQRYQHYLTRLVAELGLTSSVVFTGPLYHEQKTEAFAAADAFVLSSVSEGLPIAVLEAMACQCPVVITRACHLDEVQDVGAGLVAEPGIESLQACLAQMLAYSDDTRREMGRRGRNLVKYTYNWKMIAHQMLAVYTWMLGGGPPPSSVVFD